MYTSVGTATPPPPVAGTPPPMVTCAKKLMLNKEGLGWCATGGVPCRGLSGMTRVGGEQNEPLKLPDSGSLASGSAREPNSGCTWVDRASDAGGSEGPTAPLRRKKASLEKLSAPMLPERLAPPTLGPKGKPFLLGSWS